MLFMIRSAASCAKLATKSSRYSIIGSVPDIRNYGSQTNDVDSDIEKSAIAASALSKANEKDVKLFFSFVKESQQSIFPEGVNKRLEKTFDLVGHRHLMLRSTTFEIISVMQDWEKKKITSPAFVIDGERGCGKSVALHQIVQFARENGWLTLYVPFARSWCYEAPYVMKSPFIEGKFDIDTYGVELLEHFLHCHGAQLEQIPLRGSYGNRYFPASFESRPKSATEYDSKKLTLRDLVESGIKDENVACTAVVDLRAELGKVNEFPVLIAVDEYNIWFQKTVFGYEGRDVYPSNISVVDALLDVKEEGLSKDRELSNGLFIAAVTENYPSSYNFKKQVDYRKIRKTMRPYTNEELESVVSYYNEVNFLLEKPTDSELAYFRLMTKSVPLSVFDRASFS